MNDDEARAIARITRRDFLKWMGIGSGAAAIAAGSLHYFTPADGGDNPLARSINREWEKIYRDQYKYDSAFDWVCSPNDTHACRVRAYVRNGIVTRMGSHLRLPKLRRPLRQQGHRQLESAPVRQGLHFSSRHLWPLSAAPSDRAQRLEGLGRCRLSRTDAGEQNQIHVRRPRPGRVRADLLAGRLRCHRQSPGRHSARATAARRGKNCSSRKGYQPEMVEEMGGAGTRTVKMRGGMGFLGVIGKYGMYRLNNSLALLDAKVRGVGADKARAGRNFSNYTWHGDQAPGHPWVHGLQASECDFNDLRFSKLIIMDGKNLVENKLTDSHWFIECMERGAKIVVIAPEYGPPSTKADYWIPIRPQTDAALWLGVTKLMIDKKWYDEAFVKGFTDFPLLVRTDNLKRLRAQEIFADYKTTLAADGPSMKVQGLTAQQHAQLGDFVIWDGKKNGAGGGHPRRCRRRHGEKRFGTGARGHIQGQTGRRQRDRSRDALDALSNPSERLRPRYGSRDYPGAESDDRAARAGHRDDETGGDSSRRGHQPLVPRDGNEPRVILAANADRQHRQTGRRLPHLGGQLQSGAVSGFPRTGPGFKGWVAEDPFEINLRSQGPRQRHSRPRLHQRRRASLLESRRSRSDRQHAEVWPQKFYRPEPHADTHQSFDLQQRQPDQQCQVGLRHDQERQPECRNDRFDGHSDDRVHRVCGPRTARQLVARIRRAGNHRELLESFPANLERWYSAGLRQQR